MAYPLTFSLALGSSKTGLTLNAQLVTTSGVNSGSAVTTGFTEIGAGNYLWVGTIPDAFQGGVKFINSADSAVMAFSSINPSTDQGLVSLTAAGLDNVSVESGMNVRQVLALLAAAAGGTLTVSGNSLTITGANNSTNRIQATVDALGQRTTITLTLPS